jgi:Asp/Glu/hydantoin racemase
MPEVRIVNIVDDSLLADVRSAGRLTPSVTRRMVGYAELAQSSGASAIFNCCSSVGEAVDVIRKLVDIPIVKIDEKMAEEAVNLGRKIAVVATVATTLDPTVRLIESKAVEYGKSIDIERHLVDGAFDLLVAGDTQNHDQLVIGEIQVAATNSDVILLAQASMSRLVGTLEGKLPVPLLSSPKSGVQALKSLL